MRSEEEIREAMEQCAAVNGWGMSEGPCPFESDGERGCCAECSTMSTLQWVLGNSDSPNKNGQDQVIDALMNLGENND